MLFPTMSGTEGKKFLENSNAGFIGESKKYSVVYIHLDTDGMNDEGVFYLHKRTGKWWFYRCFYEDYKFVLEKLNFTFY
jgi:hypothetical protein